MISATAGRFGSPISQFPASHPLSSVRQCAICQHLTEHKAPKPAMWADLDVGHVIWSLIVGHRSPTVPHLDAQAFRHESLVRLEVAS